MPARECCVPLGVFTAFGTVVVCTHVIPCDPQMLVARIKTYGTLMFLSPFFLSSSLWHTAGADSDLLLEPPRAANPLHAVSGCPREGLTSWIAGGVKPSIYVL